ncbi:MAG: hypothetical protein IT330_09885 [Anaerolineae bacterium]|nr:hypothetical protein [Anaerolineae bacterium]
MGQADEGVRDKLARGEWEEVTCPRCRGERRCSQCKGTGIVGMMGIPCTLCGGGYQEVTRWDWSRFPPRRVTRRETVPGTGRCAGCDNAGRVYRDTRTGAIYRQATGK